MRMPNLSARDRRAVVMGALLVLPATAWSQGVLPYLRAVRDAQADLRQERGLLTRELQVLAGSSRYPAEFGAGADWLLAEVPRLVGGGDDGAASAALAGYVRGVAQAARVQLSRVEPSSSADAGGGVTSLPLEVSGEGDIEGIMTLLHLLETGPKLVHVTGMTLDAGEPSTAPPVDPAQASFLSGAMPAHAAVPETIGFRLRITGFTLAEGTDLPTVAEEPAVDEEASASPDSTVTEEESIGGEG
ncbi:MAG TPA: GspMb/PilO family protein [Longimicrobium sp.]|uniref:GspMb/PilO family protein n=1 Tax=Longimicrobium sp. TaxID=2029185 RepID=UPI002ED7D92B